MLLSGLALSACGTAQSTDTADAIAPGDGAVVFADVASGVDGGTEGGAGDDSAVHGSGSDATDTMVVGAGPEAGSDVIARDSATTDALVDAPSGDGGPAGCHTSADCDSMSYCRGVLDGPCMGSCAAFVSACTTDSQCDAGVCRSASPSPPCFDSAGPAYCLPRCQSDGDCAPEDECASDGHCDPRPCSTCPPYLQCLGGSVSGLCKAKSCMTDGDCAQGHCVNASCQGTLGICEARCG